MQRVVKPGGLVGVMFYGNATFLPGYPVLEAELNLAHAKINPYLGAVTPRIHHMNALGWLREKGLENLSASAYTACHNAPLTDDMRCSVLFWMNMLWKNVSNHISKKDWKLYREYYRPWEGRFNS